LHLRRFCLIAIDRRVPDESTVRKLTRRLGAETVNEITRLVIAKAQRETRFVGRAVRVDSTVIEADIRYPSDAMLALQGTRTLAREASKLAGMLKRRAGRVRDRSRSVSKTVRAISKTLARRTGEAKAQVMKLNERAGAQIARSAREARRLVGQARRAARGRGARAKLRAAAKLEQLAGRCEKVCEQISRRARGLKINNRLVSIADPDARPIRKGKLGKMTEFGYVCQIAEVTPNTRRGARGFVVPAATQLGNPAENTLLPDTMTELQALGIVPRELVGDGGSFPARPARRCRPAPACSSRAATSRALGAPASAKRATEPAAKAASVTSSAATGYAGPGSKAITASRPGPAGRSSPTTSTPTTTTLPDRRPHPAPAHRMGTPSSTDPSTQRHRKAPRRSPVYPGEVASGRRSSAGRA